MKWSDGGGYSHGSEVVPMKQVSKSSRKEDSFLDWCGLLTALFNFLTEALKLYQNWKAKAIYSKTPKKEKPTSLGFGDIGLHLKLTEPPFFRRFHLHYIAYSGYRNIL